MSRKFQFDDADVEKNSETRATNSGLLTHSTLPQPSTDEQRLRAEISLLYNSRARMLPPFDTRREQSSSFPLQQPQRFDTAYLRHQADESIRDQQMAFMRDSISAPILPPSAYFLSGFGSSSTSEQLDRLYPSPFEMGSGRVDLLRQQVRLKTEQVNALRQEYMKRARARQIAERKRKLQHDEEAVQPRTDYRTLTSSTSVLPGSPLGYREQHALQRSSLRAEDPQLRSSFAARASMDSSSRSQNTASVVVGDTTRGPVRKSSAGPTGSGSTKKVSKYQLLIRDTIEFFPVQPKDIALLLNIQGRKKNIQPGQVGMRCKYCAHRPPHWRGRGAVYFPGYVTAVYQSAQNMASNHFLDSCQDFPAALREELAEARSEQKAKKCRTSGGNQFWMATCEEAGINERRGQDGLWMDQRISQKL